MRTTFITNGGKPGAPPSMTKPVMGPRGRLATIVGLFFLATTLATAADARTQTPIAPIQGGPIACRTNDSFALNFRDYIASFISRTDSTGVDDREAWDLLPASDTSAYFISDLAKCDLAARVHAKAVEDDTLDPPEVFLLRAGPSRYIAFNATNMGGRLVYALLDSTLTFRVLVAD